MKIQCIAAGYEQYQRLEIPLGGTLIRNQPDPRQVAQGRTRVYVFARNDDFDLVGEVDKPADIMRLLAIREAYIPYGEDAVAEATKDYGWSEEAPEPGPVRLAAGQPPVVEEMIDDDDDSNRYDGEDDDDLVPAAKPLSAQDAPPPADDADGEEWIRWGHSLPGVENPNNKDQLAEYALQNFGLEVDKRAGVLKLLKQIAAAHEETQAA